MDYPQTKILKHLKRGRRLTVGRAWRMYGTSELRRVVSRLRAIGHDVKSKRMGSDKFNTYWMAG